MPDRKRGLPPPTAGDVLALYRAKIGDGQERRLRTLATNFRILTKLDHAINIPEQYRATTKEIRTPFIRDSWQRITASLTHNDWLVHLEPKKKASEKAKRASSIGERWAKSLARQMDKAVEEDVPYEAAKSMVRDAESAIKTVLRNEAWATFPRRDDEDAETYLEKVVEYKKGSPAPFAWRNVDRLQLLFGDGEFGDEWVIEYGEYPRPYLRRTYGMRENPTSGSLEPPSYDGPPIDPENVKPEEVLGGRPTPEGHQDTGGAVSVKVEYFDCDWWHVVIDGHAAPGFPKENPYAPRLPYARAKPDAEPEPVLFSLLFLVPALDAILTAWTNWMWLGMFPNPLLQDRPNTTSLPPPMDLALGNAQIPSAFKWSPGKMLEIPAGKEFSFMQPPPVGSDAKEMVLILRDLISIAGIPSVFRGINMSGDSGYLANSMIDAVEMMFKRLARARERQLEKAIEFLFYLIPARIKQTVYVAGLGDDADYLGLRPDGEVTETMAPIDQLGEVEVTVRPDLSTTQQARAMIARQLTEGPPQSRLDSRRHAMEHWLGYEDPDSIIDEIWVEEAIATNPVINEVVMTNAIRMSGLLPPAPPPPPPAPAPNGLVGPDGMPLMSPEMAGLPGQVTGGLPSVPGLNMPLAPQPPQGGAGPFPGAAGGPAGAYPGLPPNPVI